MGEHIPTIAATTATTGITEIRGEIERQRVGEVAVFAAAEPMTGHDDAGPELRIVVIGRGDVPASVTIEEARQRGDAALIELGGKARPVGRRQPVGGGARNAFDGGDTRRAH